MNKFQIVLPDIRESDQVGKGNQKQNWDRKQDHAVWISAQRKQDWGELWMDLD
jgi:hypothetical protein